MSGHFSIQNGIARRHALLAALFALLSLSGCSEGDRLSAGARDGRAVADAPRRIVCGSPAVVEIVFALKCGDRVVGVSDHTVYPPEAKEKESIGGWINPNRERLLMLKPDIIISQGRHGTLAAFAEEYGIRFHTVKLDSLADIYTAIETIAEALGLAKDGETLKADIRRAIGAISRKVANAPPKRVLLLFGRTPGSLTGLATIGPGTFLDDMIRIAGGANVFGDAMGAYPRVSKESLLVRKPEVILEVNPGGLPAETIARLRADWRVLEDIPAVRNGRIHYLTNDHLLIPGPRVALIAGEFAEAIHQGRPPWRPFR